MNNNYYQSYIKTSRQEDGIYAMRYASQQMLIDKLQEQLETYENMRKEAKKYIEEHIIYETDDCINGMQFCSYHLYDFSKEDLLNILNKVGGSDE